MVFKMVDCVMVDDGGCSNDNDSNADDDKENNQRR